MKKFNETIKVEVSVDSIASKLLAMFNTEEKHAEKTTEAIIGNLLHARGLSQVYNSINGYSNDINFEVGDKVMCSSYRYTHKYDEKTTIWISERIQIGEATIIAIDIYASNPIIVEYTTINHKGEKVIETDSVSIDRCSTIPREI